MGLYLDSGNGFLVPSPISIISRKLNRKKKKAQDKAIMHYLVILIENRMKFDHFDPFRLLKCDEKNPDNFFSGHFLLDLRLLPSLLYIKIYPWELF